MHVAATELDVRRPNRQIEIFSMSVLDMFGSALGAFILIAVILFPFYNQSQQVDQKKENVDALKKQLEKTREQIRLARQSSEQLRETGVKAIQIRTQVEDCNKSMALCRIGQSRPFLVIAIEWKERCDVDLYVKDPHGNQFYYGRSNRTGQDFPDTEAQLSVDMRDGPGTEMWVTPVAEPGHYEISYRLAGSTTNTSLARITGYVIDRDGGLRPLPQKEIALNQAAAVADLEVTADGSVAIAAAAGR